MNHGQSYTPLLQVISVTWPGRDKQNVPAQSKYLRKNCALPPVSLAGYEPCPHCWLKGVHVGTIHFVRTSPDNPLHWCEAHAAYAGAYNQEKRNRTEVAQTARLETAMKEASEAPIYAITPFQFDMISALNSFIDLQIAGMSGISKPAVQVECARLVE